MDYAALLMFLAVFVFLLLGYPVALTLAGTSLIAAGFGVLFGFFDAAFLYALPSRLYGIMTNQTLIAVPLFVLMGVILERSRIAEDLLDAMTRAFGRVPGGLGLAVCLVGMMMAASTGIVGATVVTMGLMALPTMLKAGYHPALATGTICATGTLGQIIPPSIALVLLGDVIASGYQQAQLSLGIFNPKSISVGDLFAGAIFPGLLLVALYSLYILGIGLLRPSLAPPADLLGCRSNNC
jgi:tripartite ATP-independent transporter DctM subunit